MKKNKKPFYADGNLFTVKQFVERHPFLTEASLRWQMHKKNSFGLHNAFLKIFSSKNVLVDEKEYFRVMIEHQKKASRK